MKLLMKNKILLISLVLTILYLLVSYYKNKGPNFLITLTSDLGEIRKNTKGEYELVLEHVNNKDFLMFSDRPYRLVNHIKGDDLKNMWNNGYNSLQEDPPNAVIIINEQLQTVTLTSINVDNDRIIYTLKPDPIDSSISVSKGKTVLFVDSCCHDHSRNSPSWTSYLPIER